MDLSQCEETSKKKQTCLNTSWFLLNKELFMRDLNLLSKKNIWRSIWPEPSFSLFLEKYTIQEIVTWIILSLEILKDQSVIRQFFFLTSCMPNKSSWYYQTNLNCLFSRNMLDLKINFLHRTILASKYFSDQSVLPACFWLVVVSFLNCYVS